MEKPKVFRKAKLNDNEFADVEKMVKVGKKTVCFSSIIAGATLVAVKNKELIKNTAKQVIEVSKSLL